MSQFFEKLTQELIKLGAAPSEADELANAVNKDHYADDQTIAEIAQEIWSSELATREALDL